MAADLAFEDAIQAWLNEAGPPPVEMPVEVDALLQRLLNGPQDL